MKVAARRARLAVWAAAAQSSSPDAGALTIGGFRSYSLREPASGRRSTVIRLETRAGLAGWGQAALADPRQIEHAKAVVIGQAASAYEPIRRRFSGSPELEAAVNMALLDLVGKHTKAPLYQVLGGPTRSRVRVAASLAATPEAVRGAFQAGYRAVVVPTPAPPFRNSGQAFVKDVRETIERLLQAAPGCDIILDGSEALTPGDAASVAAAIERFHLLWFDEPCGATNLATLRKIAGETVTPIGLGRHIRNTGQFQDLLREDVVDVLRPSLAHTA